MPRLPGRVLWIIGLAISIGCASTFPLRLSAGSFEALDDRVRQGCYDCLVEARDAYRTFLSSGLRAVAARRLFEVELLIALREQELALDAGAALARAADLARSLPATIDADRYLAAVLSLPHDRNGWPRRELQAFRRAHAMTTTRAEEEVAWLRTGALAADVNEYLSTAIECVYGLRPRRVATAAAADSEGASAAASPLVRYRRAICGAPRREALQAIRATEPGFVETSLFLGQLALATIGEGGDNPHLLVEEALRRFPESPAVTYLAASLQHVVADWDRALTYYDQTLALKPAHEDAWLGRTIAFTELQRTDDAIDTATRMIDLELDNVDQAYYWRAFNRHSRAELKAARADIDAARRRRVSEEILTMAGIVEHDQDDIESADPDLRRARELGRGRNCRAEWYLGSVLVKQRQWVEAATTFESAMHCYARDVADREGIIRSLTGQASIDPAFRRSRIARLKEEIRIQRRQHHTAAFNAANFHAHSGDLEKARVLVDVASGDPDLGDDVAELRRHLAAAGASRRAGGS